MKQVIWANNIALSLRQVGFAQHDNYWFVIEERVEIHQGSQPFY